MGGTVSYALKEEGSESQALKKFASNSWSDQMNSQDQVRIVKAGMKTPRSHSLVVVMVLYAPKEEGLESQALKKFASNSWSDQRKSQDQVRTVKALTRKLNDHSHLVVTASYAPKEEDSESQALKRFVLSSWSDQMKSQDQVRTVEASTRKPNNHSLVAVTASYAPKEEGSESQALKEFASSSWPDQMKSQDQVRTVRASTRKPKNHSLVAVTVSCVPTEEGSEFQAEEKFALRWWSDQMKSQD